MYPYSIDPAYQNFINTLLVEQKVYILINDEDDWAECSSSEYESHEGEPIPVYCVWASVEAAQVCQTEEWANYQIEALSLADFLQDYLLNLDEDEILVGVEFDVELYGMEIEPIELLGDILDAAEQQGLNIAVDDLPALINYRLEWERWAAGQSRLN